jgi:hypothetical protein
VNEKQSVQEGGSKAPEGTDEQHDRPQFCPSCGKLGHIA